MRCHHLQLSHLQMIQAGLHGLVIIALSTRGRHQLSCLLFCCSISFCFARSLEELRILTYHVSLVTSESDPWRSLTSRCPSGGRSHEGPVLVLGPSYKPSMTVYSHSSTLNCSKEHRETSKWVRVVFRSLLLEHRNDAMRLLRCMLALAYSNLLYGWRKDGLWRAMDGLCMSARLVSSMVLFMSARRSGRTRWVR